MGSNIESIEIKSNEALIEECIQEFENYRDYISIVITLLEVTRSSQEFGKFGGPEIHVQTNEEGSSVELTPDALIDVGQRRVICVEIKTGKGSDSKAIVDEVKNGLRYCSAKSWRVGERKRLIDISDLFIICTKDYWAKLKILMESNHSGIGTLLQREGVSILTWEFHQFRIRIRRRHGSCRHEKYESHLQSKYLVQTDNALLVEHSKFLFTPLEPPPVYTAVMLLTAVLPPRSELELSVDEIHKHTRDYALKPTREGDRDQIRSSWIRKAMDVLEKCNYAKKEDSKYALKTPKQATKESLVQKICAKLHKIRRKKKKPKFEIEEDQSLLPDFFD